MECTIETKERYGELVKTYNFICPGCSSENHFEVELVDSCSSISCHFCGNRIDIKKIKKS